MLVGTLVLEGKLNFTTGSVIFSVCLRGRKLANCKDQFIRDEL